jgi:hypothetical protein
MLLAEDRDEWRDVVNMVNEPLVSIKCREFVHQLRIC